MMIGSEGILGIITQAWMRLQDRPTFRAGGAVRFKDFFTAARAVRAISQAGLYPSNCRILDPAEAYNTGAADGSVAVMVLAFESADHDVGPWMKRARECCADHGGVPEASGAEAHLEGAAGVWRNAFIRMPYAMERLILRGVINDTFETVDHLGSLREIPRRDQARDRERDPRRRPAASGQVTCRFTHVYPDGPAPYFTFHALGEPGKLGEQWRIDQGRGARCRDREWRHRHAPSRGRARSSPVVRQAAPAAVRRRAARRQEGARPARPAQSRRADRSP